MILSDIRTLVRQRADQENSQFVKDAELTAYINASYAELYDLLVSRYEDYFIKDPPYSFTLANGVSSAALPSDFYKARGVDFQSNGPNDWVTVQQYNFAERNTRNKALNRVRYGIINVSYRIVGNKIQILPSDQADGNYRLWYIPRITKLVSDSDDMAGVLDFEEYVVVDSAIKCLIKEESDTSVLMVIKDQLKQRIIAMSANRDAGAPDRIADVSGYSDSFDSLFPR